MNVGWYSSDDPYCPACGRKWRNVETTFGVGSPGTQYDLWSCDHCGKEKVVVRDIEIVNNATGRSIDIDWVDSDGGWYISVEDDPSLFDGVLGHGRCVSLLYAGDAEYASYYALYEDGSVLYDIWFPHMEEENEHDYPIPETVMDRIRRML